MSESFGHVLVVDDNRMNRTLLSRALIQRGHTAITAENGRQALDILAREPFDVILLDLVMPVMDGYETLSLIMQDPNLRHIPVIIISAVEEMDSVLRCIELGATDYLNKPFDSALLKARLNASLASKHLRDLELEYLQQVQYVMDAAGQVEAHTFDLESLDEVSKRDDALGQLARVFQRMAREVQTRHERLKQQVKELRIEIDKTRQDRSVDEITETGFFKALSIRADQLRDEANKRSEE